MFIDLMRFGLAVMLWATIPAGLAYWLLIHGFVGYWRRVGVVATWLVVLPACLVIMAAMWRWGGGVVERSDLGTHVGLFAAGVVLWGVSVVLDRRARVHLDAATMLGVREVGGGARLLDEGLYGRVRHPRYLSLLLGATGWAMMANHVASYLMVAALVPGIWIVVTLEERELNERFGEAWLAYRARVPAIVPRRGAPRSE
ncbi:MAG: methyltransferase [Longimicrobiales bacterium]|nr:methyltransferase [Longimicrobiales bacterium]